MAWVTCLGVFVCVLGTPLLTMGTGWVARWGVLVVGWYTSIHKQKGRPVDNFDDSCYDIKLAPGETQYNIPFEALMFPTIPVAQIALDRTSAETLKNLLDKEPHT